MTTLRSKDISCSGHFKSIGSSMTMNSTGFDTATVVMKVINKDNKDIKQLTSKYTLGDTMAGRNEMYLTEIVSSDNVRLGTIELRYKGFLDSACSAKAPVHQVSAATSTAPIELHPNYSKSKWSWGQVFGDGDSPNEFGRILDQAGAFVKFGPLPDGKDGREGYYAKCTPSDNGPHCRLMGVEDFLALGQTKYTYKVLTKTAYTNARNVGKIVKPTGGEAPRLPDFQGSSSDWLLTSFNSNKICIGKDAQTGTFFENEFEFLSSVGGWNKLLYQNGSSVRLPRGSSVSW